MKYIVPLVVVGIPFALLCHFLFIPEFKRQSRWRKNIDYAETQLVNQCRMGDSMRKHVRSDRHIFQSFRDSHDYYFHQVMTHVWKDD